MRHLPAVGASEMRKRHFRMVARDRGIDDGGARRAVHIQFQPDPLAN
jgi:hypothetical protein